MPPDAPLLPPDLFLGLADHVHLAAGGETPPLKSHATAAASFFADKADGMRGRARFAAIVERTREKIGRLAGMVADEVGFLGNSSDGMAIAAAGLDLRPGDNLVCARAEFPSVMLAFQALKTRGVEVRLVGEAIVPQLADFAAAVDQNTRAIAVSHVSHLTGARTDLAALRGLADRVGARLLVDASHSLGVLPVEGRLCDVLVACCYKWLLGVHGVAVFAVNRERWPDLAPRSLGWHAVEDEEDWRKHASYRVSAGMERFEPGNLPFLNLYLLENGVDHLLRLGVPAIRDHVEGLAGYLRNGLVSTGLDVVTPEAAERRAGNVSFLTADPAAIEAALRERGVVVWAGEGRVRASVHLYNRRSDVDRLLAALAEIL